MTAVARVREGFRGWRIATDDRPSEGTELIVHVASTSVGEQARRAAAAATVVDHRNRRIVAELAAQHVEELRLRAGDDQPVVRALGALTLLGLFHESAHGPNDGLVRCVPDETG